MNMASEEACDPRWIDAIEEEMQALVDKARLEIEDFLKHPRVKTVVDPRHWWFTNRFHQYCIIFY